MVNPAGGEVVESSSVTVSGTATDNVTVKKVEVSLDGTAWDLATLTGASWSASLTLEEGPITIRARATDTEGNIDIASVVVTCSCPSDGPGPDWVLIAIAAGGVGTAIVAGAL